MCIEVLLAILCISTLIYNTNSCDEMEKAEQYFVNIAKKHGHTPERYEVTTEDGYVLNLFRLPGSRRVPILLQHGVLDSSSAWIVRGNDSLSISLANAKYDVWMGNLRGNTLSRRHVNLDPDNDATFWDFTMEHYGKYDLPAVIDTILSVTGAPKVNAIGHSMGNTVFYILGSTNPQYNDKINLMIALAPICYLHDIDEPVSWFIRNIDDIYNILVSYDVHELYGRSTFLLKMTEYLCRDPDVDYEICLKKILFALTGSDPKEISPEFHKEVKGYFPAGIATKVIMHLAQIARSNRFARFDFRSKNIHAYNMTQPPLFDLTKVTMNIFLVASRNDKLSTLKNVERLRRRLPNVADYFVLPQKLFSHVDFTWGRNTKNTLFPYIFDVLNKFGDCSS